MRRIPVGQALILGSSRPEAAGLFFADGRKRPKCLAGSGGGWLSWALQIHGVAFPGINLCP